MTRSILILAACLALPAAAAAQARPVELSEMMSSESFRRAGLHHLSPAQRRALDGWLTDWARAEFRRTEGSGAGGPSCMLNLNALRGAWVIAHDGVRLGRVITRYSGTDSLCGSTYSANSLSNPESRYASAGSPLSPFNPRGETPPSIVQEGRVLGYLTVNPAFCPRVDPGVLLGWLNR